MSDGYPGTTGTQFSYLNGAVSKVSDTRNEDMVSFYCTLQEEKTARPKETGLFYVEQQGQNGEKTTVHQWAGKHS